VFKCLLGVRHRTQGAMSDAHSTSWIALLRPDVLVEVFSFITYDSRKLAWFRCLSSAVSSTLSEDNAWRHLCRKYWFATDERLQDWPRLSPQSLYRALEQWIPLEGYYTFTPAFPWGLLVLVRILDGHVTANVIRLVPRGDGTFEEVSVPLFRIAFGEERAGVVRSIIDVPWFGGAPADVSKLPPTEMVARTEAAEMFRTQYIGQVGRVCPLFTSRQVLRIASTEAAAAASSVQARVAAAEEVAVTTAEAEEAEEDEEEEEEDPSVTDGSDDEFGAIVRQFQASSFHWSPGKLFETPEGAKEMTEAMLQDMLGKCKCPCDLALIRSPEDFVPQENDFLGVRPGLYVGDYGHAFYGQYRTEVLLVEYISITPEQLQAEIDRPSLVFARPEGEPAPRNLGRLRGIDAPLTFMRGVKQCGDFHVPMGATTFVVVCGPREACEALAEGAKFPERIINRTTGQMERVARAWRGFGTLATPGFRSPSWANGWLVQLQDNDANGAHRFGYVWDRDQDAVVLQWLVAQDTCPFLQRAWLPEDLQ